MQLFTEITRVKIIVNLLSQFMRGSGSMWRYLASNYSFIHLLLRRDF